MALRGHYTSLNCWEQKNCFWNSILKKKKTAVNWSVQLGKSQAIFDWPNNYVFSNMICSFLLRIFPHALLERSKCTFQTTLETVYITLLTDLHIENTGASKEWSNAGIRKRNPSGAFILETNLIGFKQFIPQPPASLTQFSATYSKGDNKEKETSGWSWAKDFF